MYIFKHLISYLKKSKKPKEPKKVQENLDNIDTPKKVGLKDKISNILSNLKKPKESQPKKEDKEVYETLDSKNQDIKNSITKRLFLIIGVGILLMLFYTYLQYKDKQVSYERDLAAYQAQIEEENKIELLGTGDADVWRANTQQNIDKLKTSIEDNQKQVLEAITKSAKNTNNNIKTLDTKLSGKLTEATDVLDKRIDSLEKTTNENLESKFMELKGYVDDQNKLLQADIEKRVIPRLDINNLSLPRPDSMLQQSLLDIVTKDQANTGARTDNVIVDGNSTVSNTNSVEYVANKDVNTTSSKAETVEVVKTYEDVEMATIELTSVAFAEQEAAKEEEEKEEPKFKILAGVTKGLTLNGGLIPTIGDDGEDNVAPIMIRVDGNSIVANKSNQDLEDCIVMASAKGDLSSERVLIRTSKLTCTVEKENGSTYVFETPLKGWVIGEDGKYGLDGVLISKTGTILARTLMSGFVQGAADFMSATQSFYDPTEAANATDPEAELTKPKSGSLIGYGMSSGTSSAFERLAEYYMTLAEETVPVLEILGGRSISIILNGGEEVEDTESKVIKITEFQEI
jgi:hypothetical protein